MPVASPWYDRTMGLGTVSEPTDDQVRTGAAPSWGLYVHIPFCPYKCAYCDFVAVGGGARVGAWHGPYLEALRREAAYWRGRLAPVPPASVFYGGGTPTAIGASALAALHRDLIRCFGVVPGAEVSVECNPGTVDAEGMAQLAAAGVGRVSIGLQASQDHLLTAVGRYHGWADFTVAFAAARAASLEVNVDLMYGLPSQDLDAWRVTLERVVALRPDHVSAYGLQVEQGTPLAHRVASGAVRLPDEETVALQFGLARRVLGGGGYEHYEISNFALPARRCRHNLLYWSNGDYLGLGIGAHSHWRGERWANTARLAVYRDTTARADGGWVASREPPDPARARSEGAFLGLRLLEGIDLDVYALRYGMPLDAAFPGVAADLERRGLCERTPGRLRLRSEAVAVANGAFAAFV